MSNQDQRIPFAKKDQREVTTFIGHELLFDYYCGYLDKQRKSAVEDFVKFSRDAQFDLTKIKEGDEYASRLSQTIVSQPIIDQVSSSSNYLNLLLQKTGAEKWPLGLKWGLEVLVVISAVVLILSITPLEELIKFGNQRAEDITLATVPKHEATMQIEEKPLFQDEGIKEKENDVFNEGESKSNPNLASNSNIKIDPLSNSQTPSLEKAKASDLLMGESVGNGFLYRGEISVSNLNAARIKITEKITEFGGRKAGAVDLGWKKTPDSSYYHFTIPEAKYKELSVFLSTYGKLKISKEKHSRVMPDGIVRLIITVDELKK